MLGLPWNHSTRAITALALVFAAGCAAAPIDDDSVEEGSDDVVAGTKVQMNDVSLLYPLAGSADEAQGYLQPWDDARGGKLLPETIYDHATGAPPSPMVGLPIEAPMGSVGLDYGILRAVAFRIDPCAGHVGAITAADTCRNQLRIIFQPMLLAQDGRATTTDDALHAIYSLSRDELVELTSDLVKLRTDEGTTDDLGPLAIHPLLEKQGILGKYGRGLKQTIEKYVGRDNLTQLAILTAPGGFQSWTFETFKVEMDGTTKLIPIPTLPDATTKAHFATMGLEGFDQGSIAPQTTSTDDLSLLLDVATAQAAAKSKQQAAFDAAVRISNPDIHSPETIDCGSCHVAGLTMALTAKTLGLSVAGNANAFARNEDFVSASDMKQTTPVASSGNLNIHIFSYMQQQPMIAPRVINETASVVAYLNGSVLR